MDFLLVNPNTFQEWVEHIVRPFNKIAGDKYAKILSVSTILNSAKPGDNLQEIIAQFPCPQEIRFVIPHVFMDGADLLKRIIEESREKYYVNVRVNGYELIIIY